MATQTIIRGLDSTPTVPNEVAQPKLVGHPGTVYQEGQVPELITRFWEVKSFYSNRNTDIDSRTALFEGEHWPTEEEVTDDEFRIVMNYIRRITLASVASLANAPKPRVPVPDDKMLRPNAQLREKLLMILWEDLLPAWYDVEMDAAKTSFGVIQILWRPDPDQPKDVVVHLGMSEQKQKRYTESPFYFRRIPGKCFYPIYRTKRHANDFLEVFHFDPGRLTRDLEDQYGISLQGAGIVTDDDYICVQTEPTCDLIAFWNSEQYILIACTVRTFQNNKKHAKEQYRTETGYTVLENKAHDYGKIPFFVLQNLRSDASKDPIDGGSMADMDDMARLNLHLNQIVSEEAEEIITNIHRPMTYASDDHQQDPSSMKFAAGEIYPIGLEEEIKTVDWNGEPAMVDGHKMQIEKSIRDLSFMGDVGFGTIQTGSSGVAAKVAMVPIQQLLELKIPFRKRVLKEVAKFLLQTFEDRCDEDAALIGWVINQYSRYGLAVINGSTIEGSYFVDINYGNLLPRDDITFEQNEIYKQKTGDQSILTTLDHLGFDDPDAELQRIKDEYNDPVLYPDRAKMKKELELMGKPAPAPAPPQGGPPAPQAPPMQAPPQADQQMPPGGPQAPVMNPSPAGAPPTLPGLAGMNLGPGQPQEGGGETSPMVPPVPPGSPVNTQLPGARPGAGAVTPFLPRRKNGR